MQKFFSWFILSTEGEKFKIMKTEEEEKEEEPIGFDCDQCKCDICIEAREARARQTPYLTAFPPTVDDDKPIERGGGPLGGNG